MLVLGLTEVSGDSGEGLNNVTRARTQSSAGHLASCRIGTQSPINQGICYGDDLQPSVVCIQLQLYYAGLGLHAASSDTAACIWHVHAFDTSLDAECN